MSRAYETFKEEFLKENCTRCGLSRGRTNLVFDRGNPASRILLVGEAPGAEEDKAGKCFVGRAGKMLDKVMQSAGLITDKDTLIVNIVKCRPPDNRPPKPEESQACASFLKKQVLLFNPAVIVLLGKTALRNFFPHEDKTPDEKKPGVFFEFPLWDTKKTVPGMVLYHPAYLLYNPKKKPEMIEHLVLLKKFLQSKKILN